MLWANLFSKKFASLPSIPSVDTTKGVKDARRASAALLYFRFFSSSAEESTATVFVLVYFFNTNCINVIVKILLIKSFLDSRADFILAGGPTLTPCCVSL